MSQLPGVFLDIARIPALAVGLPVGVGALIGYSTFNSKTNNNAWYASLRQPPGNPPSWAFGPVWTILYGMMGYASHLVVEVADKNLSPATSETALSALGLYYAQLALNFAWMPLFFTAKQPTVAFLDIAALTGTVWAMTDIMNVLPTRIPTKYLLLPYCGWLSYATYINAGIIWKNWNNEAAKKL